MVGTFLVDFASLELMLLLNRKVFHQMDGYRVFHHTGIERGKAISILEDDMKRVTSMSTCPFFGVISSFSIMLLHVSLPMSSH